MKPFLLEIGTEEIPAGYIDPALAFLAAKLSEKLTQGLITHGAVETFGTPRRLSVRIKDVAEMQETRTETVTGPPSKIGVDAEGKPTMAGVKFAEKLGIAFDQVRLQETPKGEYLCADITSKAVPAISLFSDILPEIIMAVPFPKTMRWADLTLSFARPIRSFLAVMGDERVPFKLGNLESTDTTSGHRFMQPSPIKISDPLAYEALLKDAKVWVDLADRQKRIQDDIENAATEVGGKMLPDADLTFEVTRLVEYPAVVTGAFDKEFLELPNEILITAMREHQRYFAIMDRQDEKRLLPYFIAVNNTVAQDMALVANGHERVLRARLADARFFYQGDLKNPLSTFVEKLKHVMFQAKLGSMHAKVLRVQELTGFIADHAAVPQDEKEMALRAAYLCKADLVSQVVIEFPKLQGIMGRIYAKSQNEPAAVATAIEEHYRPVASGASLPDTLVGSLVAIADKMDSICGCFSLGLIPTGASDPYALRRQGIGIFKIMLAREFAFSLKELIEKSVALTLPAGSGESEAVILKVYDFLRQRLSHLLYEDGYSKDMIAAVTDLTVDSVPDVYKKVVALEKLRALPDFAPLAIAFKRVVNIIKKSSAQTQGSVDTALFEDACEHRLYEALHTVRENVQAHMAKADYDQALTQIATLRAPVDDFFDGVMVMTEDARIRENRFALLKSISELFAQIADFSKIST